MLKKITLGLTFIIILILFFYLVFLRFFNNKEHFAVENIKKISDGTSIDVLLNQNKWSSDFTKRFKKHEVNSNLKLKELLKVIPNNTHIIDVGGHVGDTGLYLAKVLQEQHSQKNIKVIIIEPDASKVDFIEKMVKINNLKNVILIESGVSDKSGTGVFKYNFHNPGATKIKHGKGDLKIDTIDNLCSRYNVSLMHIDVEGMELQCLKGSVNTLNNTKFVMIELNNIKDRSDEVVFLTNIGFKKHEDPAIFKENGNVLFSKT